MLDIVGDLIDSLANLAKGQISNKKSVNLKGHLSRLDTNFTGTRWVRFVRYREMCRQSTGTEISKGSSGPGKRWVRSTVIISIYSIGEV
jgi:hypothetical protein